MFPTSLTDITLNTWIAYTNRLSKYDEELITVQQLPDSNRKKVLLAKNFVDKAFESAMFFDVQGDMFVEEVLKQYEAFCSLFTTEIDPPITISIDDILFGQFVDAKMMLQGGKDSNRWELMQYIITIFKNGTDYKQEYLHEEDIVFASTGLMKMDTVLAYSAWWDTINKTISENYTIFQDSGEDVGEHMKAHMERWGWINFLKSIAEKKVFDLPGSNKNSIDCARVAKLDDVLVWASEAKDYNLAVMRDMQK